MPNTYAEMYREPSKPHQCVHSSEEDGTRCRAIAMHNEMMCYHHRPDIILPVLENDPFLLENLDTREAIQHALGQIAARLACNHMDFERARLLLQTINAAMRNLPPHLRPRTALSTESAPTTVFQAQRPEPHAGPVIPTEPRSPQPKHPSTEPVILSEEQRDESKDPDTPDPAITASILPPPGPAAPAPANKVTPSPLPASSREASRTARSAEASRTARSAEASTTARSAPERDYTALEKVYFRRTIYALGFEPKTHARPASVTDEDIIARANDCRRSFGLPLLEPQKDPTGTLLAIHERPATHRIQPAAAA